jgi:Protein of unknown function (DUF3455)
MKDATVSTKLMCLYASAAAMSGCSGLSGIADKAQSAAALVPANLSTPANTKLSFRTPAQGVQIYQCRADRDGNFAWTFVAPEAVLMDTNGKAIGKHYGGPSWELLDGSKIVGSVLQRADAPANSAIPWLLISTKSAGSDGRFAKVTHLQRVNTVGGIAPSTACQASNQGSEARAPYTADYYYFIGI